MRFTNDQKFVVIRDLQKHVLSFIARRGTLRLLDWMGNELVLAFLTVRIIVAILVSP